VVYYQCHRYIVIVLVHLPEFGFPSENFGRTAMKIAGRLFSAYDGRDASIWAVKTPTAMRK
jgi:hypothetical protein